MAKDRGVRRLMLYVDRVVAGDCERRDNRPSRDERGRVTPAPGHQHQDREHCQPERDPPISMRASDRPECGRYPGTQRADDDADRAEGSNRM
jgi:hypothetical protein